MIRFDAETDASLERVAWGLGAVAGTIVLVAAALVVAGYVAGGQQAYGQAPAVDHAEPAGEVVADSLVQLAFRDHRTDWWMTVENRTSGEYRRGIVQRVTVAHSTRRVRRVSWGRSTLGQANGTVTPAQEPDFAQFGNRYYYKWQWNPHTRTWRRIPSAGTVYDRTEYLPITGAQRLDEFRWRIVAENQSTLVVRTGDPNATSSFDALFRYRRNATATVVVSKGADPVVRRVTLRNHTGEIRRSETFVVREVGTATVERPEPAPQVTVWETVARSVIGLRRLFG